MKKRRTHKRGKPHRNGGLSLTSTQFKKRHPEIGARPGTLMVGDDAVQPIIRAITYCSDKINEREIIDLNQLATITKPGTVTWIDVQGFGDTSSIQQVGDIFEIHPLALEDIVNVPQRPKAETYGSQTLVITRMVSLDQNKQVQMEQVAVLLSQQYVLTFQEKHGDVLDPLRDRIRLPDSRIRKKKSDYLAYAIIDTIVDGYYPVIDQLGDHLERLENVVMESPSNDALRRLNQTKNLLVDLRRVVWPQREAVNSLIREENQLISDEVRLFLRDTYDHCAQTAEVIEMYRDMATGLVSIYLSSVANRSNDVMKVLTIMASIFIPLTFMAEIYGMNFEHMPELHFRWSYPILWAAMLGIAGGMTYFFYRKGWLSGQNS